MSIAVYTLTSALHDEAAVGTVIREFLESIDPSGSFDMRKEDYADYGSHDLDLIYVRTGGTEGIFLKLLPALLSRCGKKYPFYLLTSGKSNSLAASLEILSYLRRHGLRGEVIHGSPAYIRSRIQVLEGISRARHALDGQRLGIVGKPSDWLIASEADASAIQERLGITLVDIPMAELEAAIDRVPEDTSPMIQLAGSTPEIKGAYPGAIKIYNALKDIILRHQLNGFTLRCFDLLSRVHNTGCLALAKLNAEGYVAGCEGDVPALLSMAIARALTGVSGFQANPAQIDPQTGEILFAHCTVPLDMTTRFSFDTHFESGIGIGIRGHLQEGPVTVFKTAGDLGRYFASEGMLVRNQSKNDLCRTQIIVKMDAGPEAAAYFLNNPIGNHHIILPGHWKSFIDSILAS